MEYSPSDNSLGRLFVLGLRSIYPTKPDESFRVAQTVLFDAEFTEINFSRLVSGLSLCIGEKEASMTYPPQNINYFKDKIYKYFSPRTANVFYRNFAVFLQQKTLLGAKTEWEDINTGEAVISYPYVKGDHIPSSAAQFLPIIEILFSLHQLGFVHGDIRLANMLFAERVSESRIIDWDYGGKEGEAFYPPGYACALVDGPRHPEINIKSVASGTLQVKKTRLICVIFSHAFVPTTGRK